MSKPIHEQLGDLKVWETIIKENGQIDDTNRVRILEAFSSPDAPILFPKVISRTLREAAEPQFLVTPLLQVVRLGQGRSMEFPAVNAIQAGFVAEGGEYPDQALAFAKAVEGKVSKKGVKLSFTDEVISDAQWDVVGLHVRAAGRAMARLKEQIGLEVFREAASVVFDNDDAGEDDTTGRDIDGAFNETITWEDVVDMASIIIQEKHVPTDFIMHPLMWAVFLKTAVYQPGGPAATGAWNIGINSPNGVANGTAPLGLNVIVSPFVSFTAKTDSDPAKSDLFLVDRNEIGVLLVKDEMSMDDWTDQSRDIQHMKLKERYDIIALGDGEGIAVAKNVSLARNYEVQVTNQMA